MNRTPHQVLATLESARTVADELHSRLSTKRDVMDLGDLAHIQTTVNKLEELFGEAAEYEAILRDRLHRTAARLTSPSVDVATTRGVRGLADGGSGRPDL